MRVANSRDARARTHFRVQGGDVLALLTDIKTSHTPIVFSSPINLVGNARMSIQVMDDTTEGQRKGGEESIQMTSLID